MVRDSLGARGEGLAREYLKAKGYSIIASNFKNKLGEIDIIAKDKGMIVFVEVKTRVSLSCGWPYESVSRAKQKKIARVAWCYLKLNFGTIDVPARFDVVSVHANEQGIFEVMLIKNAFDIPI